MKCKYHYCKNEAGTTIIGKNTVIQKTFCSRKCLNKYYVDRRRWELKLQAIAYKGGKCQLCGYKKCPTSLEFHHRNPAEKEFEISHPHTRSWEKVRREIDKCDLVCSNCHKEVEFDIQSSFKDFIPDLIKKYMAP